MLYLIIVSVIWALSFGLIKGKLVGLDSHFVSFARLAISFVFFLPFLRIKQIKPRQILVLMAIGAVQFGMMYIFYIYSYSYLKAWQIALFTIFTPLYVTLINDLIEKRFHYSFFFAALLSVTGAAVIVARDIGSADLQLGFLLMQLSNICFAAGQVYYKKVRPSIATQNDVHLFFWLFTGAMLISGLNTGLMTEWSTLSITSTHIYTLLYLGVLASGVCFFLWNYGALKVNTGTLAVFNNLKVPLGMAASIFIFSESGNFIRMFIGGALIVLAIYLADKYQSQKTRA